MGGRRAGVEFIAGDQGPYLRRLLTNNRQASDETTSRAPSGSFESRTATNPGRLRATSTQLPLCLL
jgi:hypothetical protein